MVKIDNTFDDYIIKIGETQEDNIKIISESKQYDLWFHLMNFPSCHVISHNKKYPNIDKSCYKKMIKYCAMLVKQNSKYKNYAKIKVNYTQVKNIKKTNIKGTVIIKGKYRTIIV